MWHVETMFKTTTEVVTRNILHCVYSAKQFHASSTLPWPESRNSPTTNHRYSFFLFVCERFFRCNNLVREVKQNSARYFFNNIFVQRERIEQKKNTWKEIRGEISQCRVMRAGANEAAGIYVHRKSMSWVHEPWRRKEEEKEVKEEEEREKEETEPRKQRRRRIGEEPAPLFENGAPRVRHSLLRGVQGSRANSRG